MLITGKYIDSLLNLGYTLSDHLRRSSAMSAKRERSRVIATAAMFLITLASVRAYAQATWGAISGFVTDQSGAAVPHAKIRVTNEKTGVENEGTTETAGLYSITHLDPGQYTVTVEAAGFRRFAQQHIMLQVDSTVRVDPKLAVGELNQEVTVTASVS